MAASFDQFFRAASGHPPYLWQCRLACGELPKGAKCELENPDERTRQWLLGTNPDGCQSRLIDIPTGLGKTAGVVLAWLWNRLRSQSVSLNDSSDDSTTWPRRLVYCLPMRTLVEQTEGEVRKWLDALEQGNHLGGKRPRVVILMGGEELTPDAKDWDLYPEEPAILIGTQDMLLSRALNRGYGMSRYRWPMHFALLNDDALWVMDEVQLMGVGLETSAQLEGFRQHFGLTRTTSSWWMSATLAADRLETPDLNAKALSENPLNLDPNEANNPAISLRVNASKKLEFADLKLTSAKKEDAVDYIENLAGKIIESHEAGSLTLVILNRVNRAQELFRALTKVQPNDRIGLIHSRFRPRDRETQMNVLTNPHGGIVVATQAIEAGIDVSARHLFTELAPWSSLVQRFGRCNRDGRQPEGGTVHWIDLDSNDSKEQVTLALPYTPEELSRARTALNECSDASPATLKSINVPEEFVVRPVLRRKDLLDLFDTTADLAGQDIDVSPFIRDGEDTDVEVFWRSIDANASPPPDSPKPKTDEICRVSINAFRSFLKGEKTGRIWRWQILTNEWEVARSAVPGTTFLIASDLGGYTDDLGWTGDRKGKVSPLPLPETEKAEGDEDDSNSLQRKKETINEHTRKVVSETEAIASNLIEESTWLETLRTAAQWHDAGKAHYHFQKMLAPEGIPPSDGNCYLAKSDRNGRCERKHFRHELASALAWLDAPQSKDSSWRDLIAYLIAAHHGKVRLSIRAMPTEQGPRNAPDRAFARGVWEGDTLPFESWPPIILGETELPPLQMNLSLLAIGKGATGEESWLERMLRLRDRPDLGPFRLAFLETLLRSADGRASQLASISIVDQIEENELVGKHSKVAISVPGAEVPHSEGRDPERRGRKHGLREGTSSGGDDTRDTRPDRTTRFVETTQGILSYSELAPLLAERVARTELALLDEEAFAASALNENILLDLHRRICGDLVPEWAGRWRKIAVTIGKLEPPAPHLVPQLMRDYGLDLQARWPTAQNDPILMMELLAFAEGRFLTIHPFHDFNGRTIRVFLLELLRRLDLPRVVLAPQKDQDRMRYFNALEAADRRDWHPLVEIWKRRFSANQ